MLVGIVRTTDLGHRGAAEFSAPDHQRVIEQTALLQVVEQSGRRLIGRAAVLFEAADNSAVVIPTCVHQHDEADTTLDHASGEQTVGAEGFRGLLVDAVRFEGRGRFLGEIEQFGPAACRR